MNSTFTEGNLRITMNNVVDARKFDLPGSSGHGLTHCMKAVDFIVELQGPGERSVGASEAVRRETDERSVG